MFNKNFNSQKTSPSLNNSSDQQLNSQSIHNLIESDNTEINLQSNSKLIKQNKIPKNFNFSYGLEELIKNLNKSQSPNKTNILNQKLLTELPDQLTKSPDQLSTRSPDQLNKSPDQLSTRSPNQLNKSPKKLSKNSSLFCIDQLINNSKDNQFTSNQVYNTNDQLYNLRNNISPKKKVYNLLIQKENNLINSNNNSHQLSKSFDQQFLNNNNLQKSEELNLSNKLSKSLNQLSNLDNNQLKSLLNLNPQKKFLENLIETEFNKYQNKDQNSTFKKVKNQQSVRDLYTNIHSTKQLNSKQRETNKFKKPFLSDSLKNKSINLIEIDKVKQLKIDTNQEKIKSMSLSGHSSDRTSTSETNSNPSLDTAKSIFNRDNLASTQSTKDKNDKEDKPYRPPSKLPLKMEFKTPAANSLPIVGIIGGTGLNENCNFIKNTQIIKIHNTKYGKPSGGQVIKGYVGKILCYILCRHGPNHDVNPSNVNYRANIYALKRLGCHIILATTACGSLKESIKPLSLCILDQYIDRTKGNRETSFHPVMHINQADPFDHQVRDCIIKAIENCKMNGYGVDYHPTGTVVTIEGPRFSSRAESHMYQNMGCSIVNMTTCPEISLAAEAGMAYAAIGLVTDYDCWHPDEGESVNVRLVTERLKELREKAHMVILETLAVIEKSDWQQTIAKRKRISLQAKMVGDNRDDVFETELIINPNENQ